MKKSVNVGVCGGEAEHDSLWLNEISEMWSAKLKDCIGLLYEEDNNGDE